MSASIGSPRPLLPGWRRIPGPPRDAAKAKLLRLYTAMRRRSVPRGRRGGPFAVALAVMLARRLPEPDATRAVERLRAGRALSPRAVAGLSARELTAALGVPGAARGEAAGVRAFARWLVARFDGRVERLRTAPLAPLRRELAAVPGVGPETADAILLHAAGRPVVVIDDCVRRLLVRHRLVRQDASLAQARGYLEDHLPSDPALLAELLATFGDRKVAPNAISRARPGPGGRGARRRRESRARGRGRPLP